MATDTQSDLATFYHFVGAQLRNGAQPFSPEESVAAFRAWQRDAERLREELGPGLERAIRGEGREIDFEEFKRRGRERLGREGIPE